MPRVPRILANAALAAGEKAMKDDPGVSAVDETGLLASEASEASEACTLLLLLLRTDAPAGLASMLVLTLITPVVASCCTGAAAESAAAEPSVASGCTVELLLEAEFPMLTVLHQVTLLA
jgi:hypothetical protein